MLNDNEVKRIIDSISEYKELVHHSSNVRDQLEALQTRWSSLKHERDKLRSGLMRIFPKIRFLLLRQVRLGQVRFF